jgi:hypothetical protein
MLHRNRLFYLIGFLREVAAITLDPSDVPTMFGPLIINPARAGNKFSDLIQNLTRYSVAFWARPTGPEPSQP